MKRFLLLLVLAGSSPSLAQVLTIKLDGSEAGKTPQEVFASLENKHTVKFFYLKEWFEGVTIEQNYKDKSLQDLLEDVFGGTDITYVVMYDYAVVFAKDPSRELERTRLLKSAKLGEKKITEHVLGKVTQRSKKVTLTGIVKDSKTGLPMQGVTVDFSESVHTVTDINGQYAITIPSGTYIVSYKYLNFEENIIDLKIYESGALDVALEEIPRVLEEVVITDQRISNVAGQVGLTSIKIADMKKMPAFLGEVDIIKQIQVLPGVTSVGEVSSGFNVRGGGVDQNLVLYDGVPIFNNSHVFGFFSAFSSQAIKDAFFYKGGIPAEYGGRISSVLSITSKEGDYQKWGAEGGIGLISSFISAGGPVTKDKTAVSFSLRSSYSDWLLKTFTTKYQNIQNSSVNFYDASLNLTHKYDEKNKLTFSGYISNDKFGLPSDTTFTWHNRMGSFKYDHIFNEKTLSSVTLGIGQYSYKVSDDDPLTAYQMDYSIFYPTLKADIVHETGAHKLTAGINSTYYKSHPTSIVPGSDESNVSRISIDAQQSLENALFLSDAIQISQKLLLDIGIRLSMFTSLGSASVKTYEQGTPKSISTITDTVSFSSGQVIKNYFGPEPRLSLRYTLSPESSIKVGYNRMYQYIHLLSNSVAVTPIDIWQPSSYYFRPQIGDQVSLGYFMDIRSKKLELSVETFYKKIMNLLEFKDGASLVLNPAPETELLTGIGYSYGAEFAVNKVSGRLSGSLNYTYSRSLRKVDGNTAEEKINNGQYYPSNFDQPNIVNLNWKYGLSRRFAFTGNFTYHTGRPVTVPYSYLEIDHIPIVNYSERNQYRIPDYHRLDLALVMEGNHKRKKFWAGTWTLSIYNVYARKNAYSVFYATNGIGLQQAYRMSIVGTALPSLSYRFKI